MAIREGIDGTGNFFKWGQAGKRVYFDPTSTRSKRNARKTAMAQGRAIREHTLKKRRRSRDQDQE